MENKNNLVPTNQSSGTKKYVDSEGYTNYEIKTPTRSTVMRFKDSPQTGECSYQYRSVVSLNSHNNSDSKISDNGINSSSFASKNYLDDIWDEDFLGSSSTMPSFPTFPTLSSSPVPTPSTASEPYPRHEEETGSSCCGCSCLGCLLWLVVFFIAACLGFYAMSCLGRGFLDWLLM